MNIVLCLSLLDTCSLVYLNGHSRRIERRIYGKSFSSCIFDFVFCFYANKNNRINLKFVLTQGRLRQFEIIK